MKQADCFDYLLKMQKLFDEFHKWGLDIEKICQKDESSGDKEYFYKTCIAREEVVQYASECISTITGNQNLKRLNECWKTIVDACEVCDPNGNHWQNCEEACLEAVNCDKKVKSIHEKRKKNGAALVPLCQLLSECVEAVKSDDDDVLDDSKDKGYEDDCEDGSDGSEKYDTSSEIGYGKNDSCTSQCSSEIGDLLARLQDNSFSSARASGSSSSNDFSRDIDNQLFSSLGVPIERSLTTAKARERVANQVLSGLEHAVEMRMEGEGQKFVYRPGGAIGHFGADNGPALGAQSLVRDTISSLRPTILDAVMQIATQTVVESSFDINEVYESIVEGLRELESEAGAQEGLYYRWAKLLLIQLAVDIRDYAVLKGLVTEDLKPLDKFIKRYANDNVKARCKPIGYAPCDIGLLVVDTNRQSIDLIVSHLRTIRRAISSLSRNGSGANLARLRSAFSAIPPSVQAAKIALRHVQAANTDQLVIFLDEDGQPGLSLHRLLQSIEVFSRETIAKLSSTPDFGYRDLRRDRIKMKVYLDSLQVAIDTRYAQMTDNNYSSGRRQLAELAGHMELTLQIIGQLSDQPDVIVA